MKHVVIVGGGFAGLSVVKKLGGHKELKVTLVDQRNYHLFQPLLYQVATAGLSPAEIAVPIRAQLNDFQNIEVVMEKVLSIQPEAKTLRHQGGEISYDYLVLACGATHSYFGHDEWETYAPGLKTLEQATEIRRRVLLAYEMAEKEKDPVKKKALMTFVVVGGGPTGVELAGALGEISRFTLSKDFRNIHSESARIILIEAGSRILASFHPELSTDAERFLESRGVQIWRESRVTEITAEGVRMGGEFVQAKTVLWAAGVRPSPLNKTLNTKLDPQGRVVVGTDLTIEGHPEVFVIGDQAAADSGNGRPLPGLAPVAMQQGRYVAQIIKGDLRGKARAPFKYVDKGQMATIGRRMAVMEKGQVRSAGWFAWMAWLVVHIYYLIGFKNRVFVFLQWAWFYFTYSRGARLIVNKEWELSSDKVTNSI